MRAQTRLWDYERGRERADQAFANMTVDIPQGVKDETTAEVENTPLQEHRMWEEQASANIVDRLQRAGLVSPEGQVDQVLDVVINNLMIPNNINLDPQVHARILLTTPLESVSVNHTILLSRGLIDVLPDESSLAAVLAHELAHIVLGHTIDTKYAFADRLLFDDPAILKKIKVARTEDEEKAADAKALEILKNSIYAPNLPKVGLFLRMLSARSDDVPHLIRPLLGNKMSDKKKDLRLAGLMDAAPELKIRDKTQISALPLGSRIKMDPWSDQLRMIPAQNIVLATAKEKLPFQVTPFHAPPHARRLEPHRSRRTRSNRRPRAHRQQRPRAHTSLTQPQGSRLISSAAPRNSGDWLRISAPRMQSNPRHSPCGNCVACPRIAPSVAPQVEFSTPYRNLPRRNRSTHPPTNPTKPNFRNPNKRG